MRRMWTILAALTVLLVLSSGAADAAECTQHDFQPIRQEPTCEEAGYQGEQCSVCGQMRQMEGITALGHDLGNWITVLSPTCSSDGLEQRSCSRCAYTETKPIEALEHDDILTVVPPTCTRNGYTLHQCQACGREKQTDTVTKTGHSYVQTLYESTCSKEGYTLNTCTVCGHEEKTDYVPKKEHTITVWVQSPTCLRDGYTRYSCTVCSYEEKRDQIKAIGHQYKATVVVPTCTADGYTRYQCTECGDAYRTDQIEKTGHHYDNGIITKEPTWTTMGRKTFTCLGCGDTYTKTTPKLTNPFVDVAAEDYFYDSVIWAVGMEITTGVDDTHFAPGAVCTRAQVVTFLWREAGKPISKSTACPFADVPQDAYYTEAVLWAVEQGITNGVDTTHFAPNQSCTRCQVLTFLHRAKGTPEAGSLARFSDVKAEDYFYEAVSWAYSEGITTGTGASTFSPYNVCTRSQIVTFLHRSSKKQ